MRLGPALVASVLVAMSGGITTAATPTLPPGQPAPPEESVAFHADDGGVRTSRRLLRREVTLPAGLYGPHLSAAAGCWDLTAHLVGPDGRVRVVLGEEDEYYGARSSGPLVLPAGTHRFEAEWDDCRWGLSLERIGDTPPRAELTSDEGARLLASFDGPAALLASLGGTLLLAGTDPTHGTELWSSDGTAAGTHLLRDIEPGPASSGIWYHEALGVVGDRYLFIAGDGEHGREIWRSDGTAEGTFLLADLHAGPRGSRPERVGIVGDVLLFSASDGEHGREPWRTDGTEAGTYMLRDIARGKRGSAPEYLDRVGDALVFTAHDRPHGREPWRTDGTREGTRLLRDIRPGPASSGLGGSARLARALVFTAGPVHGPIDTAAERRAWRTEGALPPPARNLWRTDGTPRGTRRVLRLPSLPGGSGNDAEVIGATRSRILLNVHSLNDCANSGRVMAPSAGPGNDLTVSAPILYSPGAGWCIRTSAAASCRRMAPPPGPSSCFVA
jgi:ELWxxDGT repeat protein